MTDENPSEQGNEVGYTKPPVDKQFGKPNGNRKIYNAMLKENKRGEYAEKMYPHIYTRKVSYMVKSSTKQDEPFLQHKHYLKKPKDWDLNLKYDNTVLPKIKEVINTIHYRERGTSEKV